MNVEEMAVRAGVGARFKEELQRKGYTAETFADSSGASRATVYNWQSGARAPDAISLRRCAELGIDVLYVLSGARTPTEQLSSEEADLLRRVRDLPPQLRHIVDSVILLATLAYDSRRNYNYGQAFKPQGTGGASAHAVHESPAPYAKRKPRA